MRLIEILTTLLLSLILVSCANFSSGLNGPHEVAVFSTPAQTGYRALPTSELLSLFRDAVSKDDPNQVRTLLENHVPLSQSPDEDTAQQSVSHPGANTNTSSRDEFDINTTITDQGTLLHWAAYHGYNDLVPVLLIRGANINLKCDRFKITPLIYAAAKGHSIVVTQLLNALATYRERVYSLMMIQDTTDSTALHYAIIHQHGVIVAQLLDALATYPERIYSLIMIQDNAGRTVLHWAASYGHEVIVGLLLNAMSANPERIHSLITTQNNAGWTALHRAAQGGHEAVVSQLLNALATHPERMHSLIMTQNNDSQTALYYACVNRKTETVKVLLERYKEALDRMASDTSSSAARLPSTCTDFVSLVDPQGMALTLSVTHDCDEIIDLLAQLGANLDAKDEHGDTPLHRAARDGRSAVVIALVSNGAKSQKNNAGVTPLDVAQGLTSEALNLLECAASDALK